MPKPGFLRGALRMEEPKKALEEVSEFSEYRSTPMGNGRVITSHRQMRVSNLSHGDLLLRDMHPELLRANFKFDINLESEQLLQMANR